MRDNHIDGIFVKLPQKIFRCDAFWELRPFSQVAIIILELRYWEGERRNPILVSKTDLASWISCSARTASSVITELDDWGFLRREEKGKMAGPVSERTSIYRLTWRASNHGLPPTLDYLKK